MSAHTPGPWEVRHGRSAHVAIYVAGTTHNVAVGVALKDARLIAAAPKLAYALECIVRAWPAHGFDVNNPMADAMAAKARAALAEAGVQS